MDKKYVNFNGCADDTVAFLTREVLMDKALWKKFVQVFREQQDGTNYGWRGEYWGKMMRGAAMVYAYSRDAVLYEVLCDTVRDLLTVAEADGRVSSYSRDTEFMGWDMWCRKYVILGLQYFYDVCEDEQLKSAIIPFMCGCADYILRKVGDGEGQLSINETSVSWGGLNSSSILEPIVRLYRLTKKQAYLDFATYIIEQGGSQYCNIFELAYENQLYPYQYGVSKAYEMISCFEGLLEYYEITGNEKYRTAIVNFGRAMIDSEVTVIGCIGATHELLDHAKNRQTVKIDEVRQETCVTVTWMKFCARLLKLTGDRVFADCVEQSFFNAYLGALNTKHKVNRRYLEQKFVQKMNTYYKDTFLPFDSYCPLIPEKRGWKIGGCQMLSDHTYYGCCACIGAAGVGSYLETAVMCDGKSVTVNFFESGTVDCICNGKAVHLSIQTNYPTNGMVKISANAETAFELKVRIPAWSNDTKFSAPYKAENGYAVLRIEEGESVLEMTLDMRIRVTKPIVWETDRVCTKSVVTPTGYNAVFEEVRHSPADDAYISLSRGPVVMAADSRMGKAADSCFTFRTTDGVPVCKISEDLKITSDETCLVHGVFTDEAGKEFSLIDYGSAGHDWDTVIAAWLQITDTETYKS